MALHKKFSKEDLALLSTQALLERGLNPNISKEALEQLHGLEQAAMESGAGIQDLRNLLWCSIDNDDSMDLDQLTVAIPEKDHAIRLLVAVADVDALVKKGSPLDLQAQFNTTSVYTSARIFPMLPPKLSTDLTSLNSGVDRMAIVCDMRFGAEGELTGSEIYRACVHNRCKLAYDAVSDWLIAKGPLPSAAKHVQGMDEQLQIQDRLAQKLRAKRYANGSLEFESFQPIAQFDQQEITGLSLQPHNRARQLIEEFMIEANGCMSRFLSEHTRASLRRVVRSPEKWMRIVEVASHYGVTLPSQADSKALEQFLAHQHKIDPLRFPDLSLVIVKLMGRGEYVVEQSGKHPVGHFGLAVRDYTHSTAPNRRYPDIITLRQVKAILAKEPSPYSNTELESLALHCTQQEDAAQKAERQMRKSDAALLLGSRVGQYFDGLITGLNAKGSWVRIIDPPAEGRLIGVLPALKVGQKVRVKLTSTDVVKGFIDFALTR